MSLVRLRIPLAGGLSITAGIIVMQTVGFGQLLNSDQRILGVIPNYQTVSDPNAHVDPLTVKEKWKLFAQETFDPFAIGSALMGAGFSQSENEEPKYGGGAKAFAARAGAAIADYGSQNLFSAAILASLLHQDPRYFRKGPRFGVFYRAGYAVSRVVVTRKDSGGNTFNASGVFGMGLGIATSNLYYPSSSVGARLTVYRFGTSIMGGAIGNLMSEFWPDIRVRLFHRKGAS